MRLSDDVAHLGRLAVVPALGWGCGDASVHRAGRPPRCLQLPPLVPADPAARSTSRAGGLSPARASARPGFLLWPGAAVLHGRSLLFLAVAEMATDGNAR